MHERCKVYHGTIVTRKTKIFFHNYYFITGNEKTLFPWKQLGFYSQDNQTQISSICVTLRKHSSFSLFKDKKRTLCFKSVLYFGDETDSHFVGYRIFGEHRGRIPGYSATEHPARRRERFIIIILVHVHCLCENKINYYLGLVWIGCYCNSFIRRSPLWKKNVSNFNQLMQKKSSITICL